MRFSATKRPRIVARDNTVSVDRRTLQIDPQPGRRSCAGLQVTVRHHLDGRITITQGARLFATFSAPGEPVDATASTGVTLAKAVRSLVKRERTVHLLTTLDR